MKSKKSDTWQQFWGHADGESNLRNVALREFEEESGISADFLHLDEEIGSVDIHIVPERIHSEHGFEPEHYHYDLNYFWVVNENIFFSLWDPDVAEISWISLEEIMKNREKFSTGFQAMMYKYL